MRGSRVANGRGDLPVRLRVANIDSGLTMRGAVAVICALEFERLSWTRALRVSANDDRFAVRSGSANIVVRVCGVGQERARNAAIRALRDGAEALLSWGVAGGLDPSFRPGTVLLPATVLGPTGTSLAADTVLRQRLARTLVPHVAFEAGEILSVNEVLATPQAKASARRTGAVAADMESASIGAAAAQAGRPFAVVRVVLDGAGDRLPTVSGLIAPDGRVDNAAVVRALCAPRQWAPLWRAARHI